MLGAFGKKKSKKKLSPELEAYFETPEGKEDLKKYFATPEGKEELTRATRAQIRAKHPALGKAMWGDASMYSSLLMGPPKFKTKPGFVVEAARMALESDAFLPMFLYRVRTRLLARETPVLPELLHKVCMMLAQIDIGSNVVIEPGVYIPHGQVVMDGQITIGSGTVISPWVTLGRNGPALQGPTIGHHVFIGTGAKILGPVTIGDHARIGANAVVLKDVPAHATVGGVPAKVLRVGNEPPGMAALRDAIRKEILTRDDPEARELRERLAERRRTGAVSPPAEQPAPAEKPSPPPEAASSEEVRDALREAMAGRDDPEAAAFREAVRLERQKRAEKH